MDAIAKIRQRAFSLACAFWHRLKGNDGNHWHEKTQRILFHGISEMNDRAKPEKSIVKVSHGQKRRWPKRRIEKSKAIHKYAWHRRGEQTERMHRRGLH